MAAQALDIKQESNAPVYRGGDAPMISMIERIAMDPTIPLDRLEKMLDMKERMEDRAREDEERQAKKAYFAAMSKGQAELPVVTNTRKNSHTNSTYADLAAIGELPDYEENMPSRSIETAKGTATRLAPMTRAKLTSLRLQSMQK